MQEIPARPQTEDISLSTDSFEKQMSLIDDFVDITQERVSIAPIIMMAILTRNPDHQILRDLTSGKTGNCASYIHLSAFTKEQRLALIEKYRKVLDIYEHHIERLG